MPLPLAVEAAPLRARVLHGLPRAVRAPQPPDYLVAGVQGRLLPFEPRFGGGDAFEEEVRG